MVIKVPINDPLQRMNFVAILAENGYATWIETQASPVLYKSNTVVCFCEKSDISLKLH